MVHFVAGGHIAIEPYAKIIQFRATVVVPNALTVIQAIGVQAFFPALEPASSTAILQNVIANMGSTERALHGAHHNVYPGDIVASGFVLMDDSEQWVGLTKPNQWFMEWRVRRGEEGMTKEEADFSGNTTMDLSAYPDVEDFTQVCNIQIIPYFPIPEPNTVQAILAFELYRNAEWEVGPLVWSNIDIQTNGTNTVWCSVDKFLVEGVTITDIGSVHVYPAITGITCFFTGFTLTEFPAI
ncbi:hypothetical protein EYC80_010819 [Monilinia laxa]|uniref:Uncharacterized protein n=1 Tax=Monilinia laxa TaxID=61186 RepID=A0A5N6JQR1_MONLA|nr:hypothetical protein EYC80_010819 [Monilinia laxa]